MPMTIGSSCSAMAPVMDPRTKDITGQTFDRLTALEYVGSGKGHKPLWRCRCSCGKESVVAGYSLRNGSIRSCGCIAAPDITGEKFGRLTVHSFAWTDETGKACWVCRCECGKGVVVRRNCLVSGGVKSCGCYRSESVHKRLFEDLTGKRFGRLVVVECAGQAEKHGNYRWKCRCDCGQVVVVKAGRLKSGNTATCGCIRQRHWRSASPEYRSWMGMKSRCQNSRCPSYPRYGGRGIRVHPEWTASFASFFEHIGPRPSPTHTLDRIDNDGNYEPGNVRWATPKEQAANRNTTLEITYGGRTMSAEEWAAETGIAACTIRARIARKWPDDVAVSTPVRRRSQVTA